MDGWRKSGWVGEQVGGRMVGGWRVGRRTKVVQRAGVAGMAGVWVMRGPRRPQQVRWWAKRAR